MRLRLSLRLPGIGLPIFHIHIRRTSSLLSVLLLLFAAFCVLHPAAALAKSQAEFQTHWVVLKSQDSTTGTSQVETALTFGETITRDINGGETHSFKISLIADQYVRLVVQQHGIILVARLFDRSGQEVVQMDNPSGGHGPICLSNIAPTSSDFTLQVKSAENWANPGKYEISIEELRASAPADRERVSAERAFAEGRKLFEKATKESRTAAIQKYEEALIYWRTAGDRHWEALTLYSLARTYRSLGQLQTAAEFFEKILPVQLSEQDWRLVASLLNDRGLNYSELGKHELALELLNRALKLFQDHQDRRGQASVFNNIGLTYHRIGALREANDNYQKAIPLRQSENDQQGEFNVRNNLGGVYDVSGEPLKALEQYRATLKVWRDLDSRGGLRNRDQLGIGFNNVAETLNKLGQWQEALENYTQALTLFQGTGNSQREAVCLDNIGQLYQDLGEPELALEHYRKALQLLQEKVKDPEAEGNVVSHIGTANLAQSNLDEALKNFQKALTLRQSTRGQGYALINLGAVHFLQNNPHTALEFYDRGLALLKNSDQQGEALTLYKRAEAYRLLGNQSRAFEDLSRALSLWKNVANRRGEATALLGIAQVEADLNNLGDAIKQSEAALTIIESLRTNISSSRLRASYFATQQDYFELNIDLNMRLYEQKGSIDRVAAALQASEGSRARSLIDTLTGPRFDLAEGAAVDLLKRKHEIQQRLAAKSEAQTTLLNSKRNARQADAIAKEITELIIEAGDIRDRIRTTNPKYAHLTQLQSLNLREVQNVVDDSTLLLEYALGTKRSYVWVVSPNSIDGFELPPKDQIEAAARRLTNAITSRNREGNSASPRQRQSRLGKADNDYAEASIELGKVVLGPLASLLGQKRLVIVADGALQLVPFAALPLTPNSSNIRSAAVGLKSLVSEHEIVMLPAASVLALQRRELANRAPAPKAVAVLADPVFEAVDIRVAQAKRQSKETRESPAITKKQENSVGPDLSKSLASNGTFAEARRDVGLDGRLPRLLLSRQEARSIMQVAPAGESMIALDFKASRETAVGPELSKYRIVHFATHGVLDMERPELSGVALSMIDADGKPQDGHLRLYDIYNLNLSADLVVLSACQTGIGKQIKGEGLIALTRGFMYAGAKSVVASLWKVDDAATSALMAEFYKQMFTNKLKPAAALRAAQINLSQQTRWRSPYYWAGFFIQGEWN